METIYALATARGKAGVAVIRLSGPRSFSAIENLAGSLPEPRVAGLRPLRDDAGQLLDEALVLTFVEGHSFTGEQSAELHLHGSQATVAAVLRALEKQEDLRLAEPGEFTRRALENGQLDLAQVEGLADLIEAETEAQRKQALRVLTGALGDKAAVWRSRLIRAAALLEATIDFADEDVPVDVSPEVLELLAEVGLSLEEEARGVAVSERIRDGFEVAIVGPPNAGKSTLLNALAGREAAITSEYAGTTRDVIEVRMDLNGLPVTVLDTAGLRETEDYVEGIGIARAMERARLADMRVFLQGDEGSYLELQPEADDIVVKGKGDLRGNDGFSVSGKTGLGVSELIARIVKILNVRVATAATATRDRHRIAIERAMKALESARNEVMNGPDRAELAAEEIRTAIRALDSLIGLVDVENILDEIFASFCLGK
ncbi:tRNA uridine-5-carboxymethylaminomethyl(34) synthesis GTPase MnmE [Pseudohalocynthiibacter aestuariivivens]|jgi:tRNA modification GTPase|uniref:tRNA modification GTPase MnmE n=1 Tax=Pseudohalocynthiibacter aestuariivivens TaxID=1591409 RepID=A0ABV5JM67_9RHOB|nr:MULTISPECIES: tRNA uridine-5-carboxymethylaminomethyl(34) synthesis GTPase MnmE [Pseudohalocynthiibacter]MBS9717657.1 tRNA uridine-5-carboxymethylaminomethyl(34) synthesis GTPase MnmE [Pseudohalocynthiibacter aestuariivivens]MCK0102855.1 tRNA uridine-5-carboxymethylaminomethyl(34) synthesis GTPase MnmE [Pseudohalocynthiibacter sp. F2068]